MGIKDDQHAKQLGEAGYDEAAAMLRDLLTPDLISGTAIRVARDHMMQFARKNYALFAPAKQD